MIDLDSLKNDSAISSIKLELEVITPLLMHGWQETIIENRKGIKKIKNIPVCAEWRSLSIKGIVRYWWRAIQYDLKNTELFNTEQKLFGGTGENDTLSPLTIYVNPKKGDEFFQFLLHRENNRQKSLGINPGEKLIVDLRVLKRNNENLEKYKSIFLLSLLLGGFGQRSRRGYGSLQWIKHQWNSIEEYQNNIKNCLNSINPHLEASIEFPIKSSVLFKKEVKKSNHPVLRKIWIGQPADNYSTALKRISAAGHEGKKFGDVLGATGPRKASPIHGTVRRIKNKYYPVVSEVRADFERSQEERNYKEALNKFLKEIGVENIE